MASSVARMPAGDLCSPATAARRKQFQTVERWDTRQARDIAAMERQSHEAELSNVRASSLIQMWRGMEAEASPRGRAASTAAEEAASWSDAESEKERRGVGKTVRMMSLKISSWPSSSSDESTELLVVAKERLESRPMPGALPAVGGGGRVVRVRGRKEMEGLVMRMKQERLREIAELAEEKKVSRFPFRGRIQPLIRLRFLRQEVAAIKEEQQRSLKFESEFSQRGSNSIFSRKIAEEISQHNENEIGTGEHSTDSPDSDFDISANHSETEDSQYTELAAAMESESSPQAFFFVEEDLQESQRSERSSWEDSTDLEQPEVSSASKSFRRGLFMEEEAEAFTACNWLSEQAFTNNVEIRDLLQRKTVSNFLAGDLPHKLNRLMTSFIQKQALHYVNENGRDDESGEEEIWRQSYEDCSEQEPSASFNQNSSASERDEDVGNDLREGFTAIQSEISELRKLVESCLEWQERMEFSIKHHFSSAVNQLVERGKSSPKKTSWNDTCCICCEAQVDAVLYRCGHMCACFKCSKGLQWSTANCPICRSTIIDAVRVYPHI